MKQSKIMGRALSENRWDKSSETVRDRAGNSNFVTRTGKDEIIMPLSVVGQGMPDDFGQRVKDALKVLGMQSKS